MTKVNTAPIKWAQRSDSVYITIALADVKEESIDLADETLKFKGKSNNKEYEVDIAFFKAVDAEGSTYKVLPRSIHMHVMKKEKDEEEFWPRLLKDKALEKNQVKIDWDKYVDEDEEEEGFDTSALDGGMGMGGGGGGMPGMGGGGMPGGMDMAQMMGGMGGGGGMGGPGGMDMASMMAQMGGGGGGAGGPPGGMGGDGHG
ncbi:hypothetical protein ACHAXR_013053 [Thalassiosira sp. AJA248-18]